MTYGESTKWSSSLSPDGDRRGYSPRSVLVLDSRRVKVAESADERFLDLHRPTTSIGLQLCTDWQSRIGKRVQGALSCSEPGDSRCLGEYFPIPSQNSQAFALSWVRTQGLRLSRMATPNM